MRLTGSRRMVKARAETPARPKKPQASAKSGAATTKTMKTEKVTEQAPKKGSPWSAKETMVYVGIRALALKEILESRESADPSFKSKKLGPKVYDLMN